MFQEMGNAIIFLIFKSASSVNPQANLWKEKHLNQTTKLTIIKITIQTRTSSTFKALKATSACC